MDDLFQLIKSYYQVQLERLHFVMIRCSDREPNAGEAKFLLLHKLKLLLLH